MANPISFEGHLEKLASGIFKNKTKIWMVLEDTSLMYFKNNKRSSCIGSIDVLEIQTVRQTGTKSGAHIEIRTGSKTLCFLAETSELAEAWVKVIHLSMTQRSSSSSEKPDPSSQAGDQSRANSSRTSSNIYEEINNLPSQSSTRFGVSLKKRRKPPTPPSSPTSRASSSTFYCDPVLEHTTNTENQLEDRCRVSPPIVPVSPPRLPVSPPTLPISPHRLPVSPPTLPISPPRLPVSPPRLPVSPPTLPVNSSGDTQLQKSNATTTALTSNNSDRSVPSNAMDKQTTPTAQSSTPKFRFKPPPSFSPPPPPVKISAETNKGAVLETGETELASNNPEPNNNECLVSLPNGSNGCPTANAMKTRPNRSPSPTPERKQSQIIDSAASDEKQNKRVVDKNSNELNGRVSMESCTDSEGQLSVGADSGVGPDMADTQDFENDMCSDSMPAPQEQLDKDQKLEGNMGDTSNDNGSDTSTHRNVTSNAETKQTEYDQKPAEEKKTSNDEDDISQVQMRRSSTTHRNGGGNSRSTLNRGKSTDPTSITASTQLKAQQTDESVLNSEQLSDGDCEDTSSDLSSVNSNQDDIHKYFSQEIINSLDLYGSNNEECDTTDTCVDIEDNGMSCLAFQNLKKFLMDNSDDPFDIDGHVCSTDSPMDALKAILDAEV